MNPLQCRNRYARLVVALSGLALASPVLATGITGTYIGTYSSFSNGDSGTVTITIDSYGAVGCDFYSTAKNTHHTAKGSADAGPSGTSVSYSVPGGPGGPAIPLTRTSINCVDGPRVNPGGPADPVLPPSPPTYLAAQIVFLWADSVGVAAYEAGTWISTSGDSGEFSLDLPSSISTTASINPTALTGLWYDPKYTGSGVNITGSSAGLIVTYYGWDNSGRPLWLTSAIGPDHIALGQSIMLNLTQTVGGTFAAPAPPSTATPWGTITLTFTSCTAATAALSGADGDLTESLTLLVGLSGLGCQ